ncbi:tyrosine-type recombinase/integrase [Methylobacterium sp. E-045]|uniref:tyrosine-type recombinase/integrase n=1 Tax=Methylobacterium sp. E-045 TaxID=2836575 RepID=UPI00391C4002
MQKPLTDVLVRGFSPPPSGRTELGDTRCKGLELRVTSGGARSWSFRFRDPRSGRVTRATIGSYPEVSLADARERANGLRRSVSAGVNPVVEKRREREASKSNTFRALSDRYLNEHARRFKRSAPADQRNLRLHVLPKWADRRYDEIQRRDVIDLCEGMVAAGTATNANRIQALISSVYSFAVDADLVAANPCVRLRKRGAENIGRRVLTDEEVVLFWHGIVNPPVSRRVGLALRIALLTGARVSEIAQAERGEFSHIDDPERAGWVLPTARSKNGCAHFTPLSGLARETISEAINLADSTSRFLFPSPSARSKPISGHVLSVAMQRFGSSVGAASKASQSWASGPPSPHDLRRTVATRLAALGCPSEDVSAVLNHKRRDVTGRHYDLYDRAKEKRRALNSWSDALTELVHTTDSPLSTSVGSGEDYILTAT